MAPDVDCVGCDFKRLTDAHQHGEDCKKEDYEPSHFFSRIDVEIGIVSKDFVS